MAFVVLLCFYWSSVCLQYYVNFFVQQSDLVIHMYKSFHILIHYSLSQATEYRSLCSTAGACCLSTLYIITSATSTSQTFPALLLHLATTSLFFHVYESVFVSWTYRFVWYFRLQCDILKRSLWLQWMLTCTDLLSYKLYPKRSHPQATVESLGQGMRRSNRWKMAKEDKSQGREESTQCSAHQL